MKKFAAMLTLFLISVNVFSANVDNITVDIFSPANVTPPPPPPPPLPVVNQKPPEPPKPAFDVKDIEIYGVFDYDNSSKIKMKIKNQAAMNMYKSSANKRGYLTISQGESIGEYKFKEVNEGKVIFELRGKDVSVSVFATAKSGRGQSFDTAKTEVVFAEPETYAAQGDANAPKAESNKNQQPQAAAPEVKAQDNATSAPTPANTATGTEGLNPFKNFLEMRRKALQQGLTGTGSSTTGGNPFETLLKK